MRSRAGAAVPVLLLAALVALLVCRFRAPAQEKPAAPLAKWEYRTSSGDKLNDLGSQGWEAYAVTGGQPYIESARVIPAANMTQNTIRYAPVVYHLKRRKG